MTQTLQRLSDIAAQFDVIVLDQWGVLHDGSAPYPNAIETLHALKANGARFAVLSNSGKRAAPNADRIAAMGFDRDLFEMVMSSGEALWLDISQGRVAHKVFYPIMRSEKDAADWVRGLGITLTDTLAQADAILLMGLPDGADPTEYDALLTSALDLALPIICTNPDRASPRADGVVVLSPGTLAHKYSDMGGDVTFYGKPHHPVFDAVKAALKTPKARLLMVGDSLEHDIKGGANAGWSTLFIQAGLHAALFSDAQNATDVLRHLSKAEDAPMPTFTLSQLE